jgi:hypothetical protein
MSTSGDNIIVQTDEFHPNPTWASVALAVREIPSTDSSSPAPSTTTSESEASQVSASSSDTKSYVVADSKDEATTTSKPDETPLKFTDLDADEDVNRLQSMPSICMCCFKEGMYMSRMSRNVY